MAKKIIAYLGPEGASFGYQAAVKYLAITSKQREYAAVSYKSHEGICEAVALGNVSLGVVAIENTVAGFVEETLASLAHWQTLESIKAIQEVSLVVDIRAYSKDGKMPADLKRIFSHGVGITQCSRYVELMRSKYPEMVAEAVASTGDAAKRASEVAGSIALTGSVAAKKYNLFAAEPDLKTDSNSHTRFFIVSKSSDKIDPEKVDFAEYKTMMCFEMTLAQSGCLQKTLSFFSSQDINMRVVHEIRTPNRLWEYRFLVEFECHVHQDSFRRALGNFNKSGISMAPPIIYGSYLKGI